MTSAIGIKLALEGAETVRQGVDGVGSSLGGLAERAGSLRGALAGIAPQIAAAFSVGSIAAFVKSTADALDALNDVKDATGASVEEISKLERVARLTGGSIDTVSATLVKFNQALSDAKPGSGAEAVLKGLNLSAAELKRLDPGEALRQTAVALSKFADDGNKARAVQELFGRSLREVAPFLKDLAELGDVQATVTTKQAEEAEKFNRQLALLKTNASDAARSFTADLLPALNGTLEKFNKFSANGGVMSGFFKLLADDWRRMQIDGLSEQIKRLEKLDQTPEVIQELDEAIQKLAIVRNEAKLTKAALDEALGNGKPQAPTGDKPVAKLPDFTAAQKPVTEGFVEGRIAAKAWADAMERGAKISADAKAKLDNLNPAQAALRDLMADPAWEQMPETWRDLAKATLQQADADIQAAAAKDAATKALDEYNKGVAKAAQAMADETIGLDEQLQKQLEHNAAIGLTKDAMAALEAARIDDTIATKEQTLAALEQTENVLPNAREEIQRQIAVLKALRDAKLGGAAKQAGVDAADEARKAWDKASDQISQSLTDALMRGFESGKGFIRNLRDTLVNTFRTMVLRPTVQAILAPVAGGMSAFLGGSANASTGGGSGWGNASTGYNAYSAYKSGGAMMSWAGLGDSAAFASEAAGSWLVNNTSGSLNSFGGTLMENSGSIGSTVAEYAPYLAYAKAFYDATQGKWGAAVGTAIGSYWGPWGAMAGSVIGGWLDSVFAGDAGTPHMGGVSLATSAGVRSGGTKGMSWDEMATAIHDKGSLGNMAANFVVETSPGVQKQMDGLAGMLQTGLTNLSKLFGQQREFGVGVGFADDQGGDGSWGAFKLMMGDKTLADWGQGQDKWPGREFADGEAGYKEFLAAIASDTKEAIKSIGLPEWADELLGKLKADSSLEDLIKAVDTIVGVNSAIEAMQARLEPLGGVFADIAGLSSDAFYNLAEAAGGIDKLDQQLGEYFTNFYSKAEQTEMGLSQIGETLADVGINTVPATREAFRDLVDGLNLTTEAGRDQYAALMGVAGAFAQLVPAADEAADAISEAAQKIINGVKNGAILGGGIAPPMVSGATVQKYWDLAGSDFVNSASFAVSTNASSVLLGLQSGTTSLEQATQQMQSARDWYTGWLSSNNMTPEGHAAAIAADLGRTIEPMTDAVIAASRVDATNATLLASMQPTAAERLAAKFANPEWQANKAAQDAERAARSANAGNPYASAAAEAQRKVIEDNTRALSGLRESLTDYLESLSQSDLSTLSPEAKYLEARSIFDSISRQAMAGDQAALEQLQRVSQQLLGASRGYNASGAGYVADYNAVVRALERSNALLARIGDTSEAGVRVTAQGLIEVRSAVEEGTEETRSTTGRRRVIEQQWVE